MILATLLLLSGLSISVVAIYYSVMGLMAIFSAAAIPIAIMGVSLEIGKLVTASWVKAHWHRLPLLMKTYAVAAVAILMVITSLGIFGYLSKAHSDQTLVSGDVQAKVAIYDERIKTEKDNIEADRKQIAQMDAAVDQVLSRSDDEKGASKANEIHHSQLKDRSRLQNEILASQKKIATIQDERAPFAAENRKVEAEVGPIKYIAAFVYGANPDANILEKAVTWVIILIVVVFDPLAVVMLLAAQMTFGWIKENDEPAVVNNTVLPLEKPTEPELEPDPVVEPQVEQDIEPIVPIDDINAMLDDAREPAPEPEISEEYQVDKFAYLKQPFKHFENLTPIVATRDPDEPLIKALEGEAAYNLMKDIGIFNEDGKLAPEYGGEEEYEDDGVDEDQFLEDFDENLARGHETESPILTLGIDEVDRPGDYITPPVVESPRQLEAAPARGRGVMNTHLEADNLPELGKASRSDFGNNFPVSAEKGDVYLRTDYLPNRLFKFNGAKWIEVDKSQTDVYAYNELYIKHLIDEIATGRYDADALTDSERDNIAEYLKKNS